MYLLRGFLMYQIEKSSEFAAWFDGLKDTNAQARILVRLRRFSLGNLGDVKSVGSGISEARIDSGPGYRIYFVMRGGKLIVLLCGRTKNGQQRDIERAHQLAEALK
jgi:putative addiction module killer protein